MNINVIDISKQLDSKYATRCIALASGSRPKPNTASNRNNDKEPPTRE
jgi:hypothetical protein